MNWTEQLTGQPGDFKPIISTITQGDGECLQSIYNQLNDHATLRGNTLLDYVLEGTCVALEKDGTVINLPSITTLTECREKSPPINSKKYPYFRWG